MSTNSSEEIQKQSNAWFVLGAIVMVVAGVLAVSLPLATTSLWLLGLLVGISLVVAGISRLLFSLRPSQPLGGPAPA